MTRGGNVTVERRSPISVVGAGNWLMGNDRIGPRVLEAIRGRYGPEVELCEVGHTGLAVLDHLHGQDVLLVIDACVLGGAPGEVRVVEPDLEGPPTRETSVHQVGPLEALMVAKNLFPSLMPHRILFILVETEGIDEHAEDAACRQVIVILDREIASWARSPGHGDPAASS
jgi:hydrogenase maturation protease